MSWCFTSSGVSCRQNLCKIQKRIPRIRYRGIISNRFFKLFLLGCLFCNDLVFYLVIGSAGNDLF
jgi:hypothetical protein